jgi:hypothetical protein
VASSLSHIIYIGYSPLTAKFYSDFYIEKLEQAGFGVEYWDLTSLFHKDLKLHNVLVSEKVLTVDSYKQLEDEIENKKNHSLFIFNITYSSNIYKLFRLFTKHKCLTAIFARGALPSISINYSPIKKIFFKFKAIINVRYVAITTLNQLAILAKRFGLIKPYDFIFYAGASGISSIGYGFKYGLKQSSLIPINSFDYDAYLLVNFKNCRYVQEPYCVFLDGYLPYHPDFKMMRLPQLDPYNYYTSLNKFFEWIEHTYKIKVVIAAHPKSNYEDKKSYGDRMIIKNKTAELVQHAEFVLLHASTAISFAVLFKKPLVFINTNAIKAIYYYTHYLTIIYFSELLKASYVNVEEDFNNVNISPINENAYAQYKYNFLTNPQSEHNLSENIFINVLKNYPIKSAAIL